MLNAQVIPDAHLDFIVTQLNMQLVRMTVSGEYEAAVRLSNMWIAEQDAERLLPESDEGVVFCMIMHMIHSQLGQPGEWLRRAAVLSAFLDMRAALARLSGRS